MEASIRMQRRYTYADYKTWDDDVRVELIDGIVYDMSAPTQNHQLLLMELGRLFANYLKGKPYLPFIAPSDVRLNFDTEDNTVLQPDLYVVCDKSKLDGQNCNGAPDLVIEILSPSTTRKDLHIKFHKYREAGVKEYWIVNPIDKLITVYLLEKGDYIAHTYGCTGVDEVTLEDEKNLPSEITVSLFPDFKIDVTELFKEML